jgi:hypothetical protein
VAVDKETLLTSAREAMQLATWREKEGFKLWVVNPALNIRKEIHEIRLHEGFAALAEKPNDWIYFNLALLIVAGDLPKIAPLASTQQFAELKEDAPIRWLGFTHDGRKIPAGAKIEPQSVDGSIFVTTVAEHLPGQPRLLHVEAKIPRNAYGSPIFDKNGSLVGVYGSPASIPDDEDPPAAGTVRNLHFAAVVVPQAIRRWTEGHDEQMWVLPSLVKEALQPHPQP